MWFRHLASQSKSNGTAALGLRTYHRTHLAHLEWSRLQGGAGGGAA